MATMTERGPRAHTLEQSHRQVRDPLQKLRGYIRRYVITQSLTTLMISLAIWFWVVLLLDFGSFFALKFDWVQSMPRWFRALLLGLALALVCFMVELRKVIQVHVSRHRDSKTGLAGLLARIFEKPLLLTGLAVPLLLVYLAGWIGLGILRDNGSVTSPVMGSIVAAILLVFAFIIVVKRLFYEFRDPALALVLERRFPKLLGDRLITAVELNDTRRAAEYGYSAVMLEKTIHDAADRVNELDPAEVFNWKRLYWQAGIAVVLTAGAYLVVCLALGFIQPRSQRPNLMEVNAGQQEEVAGGSFLSGFPRFHDTSTIWFERNVLLSNTRWPRKVHLEVVEPSRERHKIGEGESLDADSRRMVVRALEWVIADDSVNEGWRALLWKDLNPKLLGGATVPSITFPGEWSVGMWYPSKGLSVDEIMHKINSPQVDLLKEQDRKDLKTLRAALIKRAGETSMSRTMRRLELPREVTIKYDGEETRVEKKMTKKSPFLFTDRIPDLKELEFSSDRSGEDREVTYTLRSEDYISDSRSIIAVPRPRFAKVVKDERHPAYFYYSAEEGFIKGKTQLLPLQTISPDTTEIQFFKGSTLILNMETTKPLKEKGVRIVTQKGSVPLGNSVKVEQIDERNITTTIKDVNGILKFEYELIDQDNVKGTQPLTINLVVDKAPFSSESAIIRSEPSRILRMVNDRFIVTADAVIPVNFDILDDHGLSSLGYVYSVQQTLSPEGQARRAAMAAGGIGLPIGATPWTGVMTAGYQQRLLTLIQTDTKTIKGRKPVPHFQQLIDAQRRRDNAKEIDALLKQRAVPDTELLRVYKFWQPDNIQDPNPLEEFLNDPELDMDNLNPQELKGFDLMAALPQLKAAELDVQPRYAMQLYVEARDNNIERSGGVGVGQSRVFPITVVSETELLFEISKEEQQIYDNFNVVVNKIREARKLLKNDLDLIKSDLGTDKERLEGLFVAAGVRLDEVEKKLVEGEQESILVYNNYYRIFLEMRTNRVKSNMVEKVYSGIVRPLYRIQDEEFGISRKSVSDYSKSLASTEPTEAKQKTVGQKGESTLATLDNLINQLQLVLDKMKGITDLRELINKLKVIEEGQLQTSERLLERKILLQKQLLEDALKGT